MVVRSVESWRQQLPFVSNHNGLLLLEYYFHTFCTGKFCLYIELTEKSPTKGSQGEAARSECPLIIASIAAKTLCTGDEN
jgi:hypothetical protein